MSDNNNDNKEKNEVNRERGERIAAGIMKSLAILGLVAVLALAAWLAVQLVRTVPTLGDRMQGAVVAVQTLFRGAPETDLSLELDNRTVPVGEEVALGVAYTGETPPASYTFVYNCADSATFEVKSADKDWEQVACDTPYSFTGERVTFIPTSDNNRFLDITLTVAAADGSVTDSTLVTVVNERVADSRSSLLGDGAATSTDGTNGGGDDASAENGGAEAPATQGKEPVTSTKPTSGGTTGAAPAPTVTTPIRTPITPTGPSDLVVNIVETGVLAEVQGRNTLFPLAVIPSDKTAGVRFTVTNRGGAASGPWAFRMNLPIEGDSNYGYTSPAQKSLAPNAQVEFTLGFDEVLERSSGTIRIELVPTDSADRPANNEDAVQIDIRVP